MKFGIFIHHHTKEEKFKMVKVFNSEEKNGRPERDSEGMPYEKCLYVQGKYVKDCLGKHWQYGKLLQFC